MNKKIFYLKAEIEESNLSELAKSELITILENNQTSDEGLIKCLLKYIGIKEVFMNLFGLED